MKTRMKQLAIVLLALFFFAACNNAKKDKDVIKIGAVLPLTGQGSEFGQYIKEGMDLAIAEINKDGNKIKVIYEDSKSSPKDGVNALQSIIQKNNTKINIVAMSSVARATIPIAKANNSILMFVAVAIPGITDGVNTFKVYPGASGMAGVMAKYSITNLSAKTASIIYINDDFGKTSSNEYSKLFTSKGGIIVSNDSYEPQASDFKTQILKVTNLKKQPDVIYLNGYGPAYAMILRQLKENNVKSIITADMTLGLPNTKKIAGESIENAYYVDGVMNDEFINAFLNKYNKQPTSYSGYSYDIVNILFNVLSQKTNMTLTEIADKIKNIKNHPGAMGNISIQKDGDANLEFVVKQIVNGNSVLKNK